MKRIKLLGIMIMALLFAVVTLSACSHTHDYQFVEFVWNGTTAQARYVCSKDNDEIYYDATIETEIKEYATCEEKGTTIYIASYDGHRESIEIKDIPVNGHNPGQIVIENEIEATMSSEGYYEEVIYCEICHQELYREAHTTDILSVREYTTRLFNNAFSQGVAINLTADNIEEKDELASEKLEDIAAIELLIDAFYDTYDPERKSNWFTEYFDGYRTRNLIFEIEQAKNMYRAVNIAYDAYLLGVDIDILITNYNLYIRNFSYNMAENIEQLNNFFGVYSSRIEKLIEELGE